MAPSGGLLLDTDVVAELRRRTPDPAVVEFLHRRRHFRIFVSAITIGELHSLSRQDGSFHGIELEPWLREFKELYGSNILPIDVDVAIAWGPIAGGDGVPAVESLIAATAVQQHLSVVSGNVETYRRLAVPVINPWETDAPPSVTLH
ncbi:PIN domain-containing protein [Arthrobacter sp. B1805]|uniref:PIN domain-containing protein n=1 Tax=Arthrobacter sp. B1805 TaxID=2058892 RepID=UPI000CE53B90|nr:PIN domain-containing protein [Arthrobacter sp. B1805]